MSGGPTVRSTVAAMLIIGLTVLVSFSKEPSTPIEREEQPIPNPPAAPNNKQPTRRPSAPKVELETPAPPKPPQSPGQGSRPKEIPALLDPKVDWGGAVAAPLKPNYRPNGGPDWCDSEMQADVPRSRSFDHSQTCEFDTLRMGNFTSMEDITRFSTRWPFVRPDAFSMIDQAALDRYWDASPNPLLPDCKSCNGELAHLPAFSSRRWWRLRAWRIVSKESGNITKPPTSVLGIFKDRFGAFETELKMGDFLAATPQVQFEFKKDSIIAIRLCREPNLRRSDSFAVIETASEYHVVQFVRPRPGISCFWRTLQMLWPDFAKEKVFAGGSPDSSGNASNTVCMDYLTASNRLSDVVLKKGVPTVTGCPPEKDCDRHFPADVAMPYLPCHRFQISQLQVKCDKQNCFDEHRTFWPFKCKRQRMTGDCGWEKRISEAAPKVSQNIRVAVAFSGFIRTFGHAQGQIFEHIVKPHNATTFGCTWNVPGRTKKTVDIVKKMVVPVHVMVKTAQKLMGISDDALGDRLLVLDYLKHAREHEVMKQNGFNHPGLYFTLTRSLELVRKFEEKHGNGSPMFDIIIRTRFDVWPSVPLRFTRIPVDEEAAAKLDRRTDDGIAGSPDPHQYALDVGSSCEMQGAWWPQTALFYEGKLLKHIADTRYKLWTWQVCDWIEIGTRRTMLRTEQFFNWVYENNVWSGAQFVEHAFYVDQQIAYQPMQLFLKLVRHNPKPKGAEAPGMRSALFG